MTMTRKLAEKLVVEKGWQPYIKGHWMTARKAGYIVAFHDHSLEYHCTHQDWDNLQAKAIKESK